MNREQKKIILQDLHKKMVLLAGPKQAGKTTLAKALSEEFSSFIYLMYDHLEDRKIIQNEGWLPSVELIILDEIHKMPEWKNYLKGLYDTKHPHQKILVTGSARLEIFNQVGDSLAGRYFLHRLMPLSPSECEKAHGPYTLDQFLERGGFPEPFLVDSSIEASRWRLQYIDSLLREDVLNFENIQNVKAIRLVFDLLRARVGSPISYTSIAEDVAISPNTVKKYMQILVANCLLKHTFSQIDEQAKLYSLHYLQTKEKQEVDFALALEDNLEKIIEVKYSDTTIHPGLSYFHEKYNIPAFQVVKDLKRERVDKNIMIVSGVNFLKHL